MTSILCLKQRGLFRFAIRCGIAVILFASSVTAICAADQRLVVSISDLHQVGVVNVDDDGLLEVVSRTKIQGKPGSSCFDSTARNLYVSSANPNAVTVFRVQNETLQPLQSVSVPAKPSYLTIDPSGRFLLASYFTTGQVSVHRIVGEGRLSNEPVQLLSVDERAHGVAVAPSGKFVFVPHTRPNVISQFRLDSHSGRLSPNTPAKLQRSENTGPRHLWFHPHARFVYGSDEQASRISMYVMDTETGTLSHQQSVSSLPEGYKGKATTSHVEVHPSGKFAYIANRVHNSVAVFDIDQATGLLTLRQHIDTESMPRSFAVSPDGRTLVAAGQRSGNLVSYKIADDGQLTKAATVAVGASPWWVTFAPQSTAADPVVETATVDPVVRDRRLSLGQGTMAGEVSDVSALLQTRLTQGTELDETGDLPGAAGVVCFQWSEYQGFDDAKRTRFQTATPERDFIVRAELDGLRPGTRYYYRAVYGATESETSMGPTCSFRTLQGAAGSRPVKFIVGSCMNYIKFMHGRAGNAGGPLTATAEDKRLGFPAFASMQSLQPEFFVGTGDIVYYDNPFRVAKTVEELRRCWHEQFRFPRMIDFFQNVPAYWSKDDHDFRYSDSDNESAKLPLPQTGINLFHEQLPIAPVDADQPRTYRTLRVNRDVQIWLTEGRDFRSPNDAEDGPNKTMWGDEQRAWLKSTLQASDAKWKLIISPTPMVGPDDAYKKDNHASLSGFRHEADAFFDWVKQNQIAQVFLICGDRHWQYHSIHPSGVNEFACGALNDENARMGVSPGADYGTDPKGVIDQPYTSPEPSGGFLQVEVGETLEVRFFDDQARQLYHARFPAAVGR